MITTPRTSVRARAPAKLTVAARTGRTWSPARRAARNLKGVTALASAMAGRTESWMRLLSVAVAAPSDRAVAPATAHTVSAQITRQRLPRSQLGSAGWGVRGGDPAVLTRVGPDTFAVSIHSRSGTAPHRVAQHQNAGLDATASVGVASRSDNGTVGTHAESYVGDCSVRGRLLGGARVRTRGSAAAGPPVRCSIRGQL